MEEKNYKKNSIKILILFIIAFIFIMFLPELRTTIKIKNYEKQQQIKLDQKQEEEAEQEKKNTLNTMICSSSSDEDPSYNLAYNKNGLQKYTKIENKDAENEEEELSSCEEEAKNVQKGIEIKCEVNNGTLSKSTTYDFTKMNESDIKNNIFDFKYKESTAKIKSELESKKYTCG